MIDKVFFKKKVGLFLILIMFLSLILFVVAEEDKNIHLASIDYPPYYGPELDNYGFITEIITASFEKKGYTVDVDFMSWTDALEKTKTGEYDGLFTLWYRQDREEFYAYSSALPTNEVVFCKLIDNGISYEEYSDLSPYTVGTVQDYTYPDEFLDANLNTKESQDDKELLGKLFNKEVDIIIIDRAQAKYITQQNYAEYESSLDCFDKAITINNQYIGFSKNIEDSQTILLDFNSGLNQITSDGTYDNILKKHGYEEFAIQKAKQTEVEIFEVLAIKLKAFEVAKEIEKYLEEHPDMTIEELQNDPFFQDIAIQPIGKTGYTTLNDANSGIMYFHHQVRFINKDSHIFEESAPDIWEILDKTIGEGCRDSSGFYKLEETNKELRDKYMYLACVDKKTADGKSLFVAATTYLDEYVIEEQASSMIQLTSEEKAWLEQHPVIRHAPDPDYAPYEFFDKETGDSKGLATDYLDLVAKKLGIKIERVHSESWADSLENVKQHNADMVTVATETPVRSEYMLFTSHYIELPDLIIVKDDREDITSINDLKGKTIVTIEAWAINDYLKELYPEINLKFVPDVATTLQETSLGQVDATFLSLGTASSEIKKNKVTNLKIVGETGYVYRLSFASRKDWPILNTLLEKAIKSLTEEEIKTVNDKWFSLAAKTEPEEPTAKFQLSNTHIIIIIIILLIILFIYLIYLKKSFLKVKINRKIILWILTISIIPLIIIGLFSLQSNSSALTSKAIDSLNKETSLKKDILDTFLINLEGDVLFLSDLIALDELINEDDKLIKEKIINHLGDEFLSFSKRNKIYYQLRYIDENGQEIIRINSDGEESLIIPKNQLQDKKSRYYFEDTMKLSKGEVFISPLDLNIEHIELENRGTPENPIYVPVIRYGTPIFNNKGESKGIIITNVYVDILLDLISEEVGERLGLSTFLVNKDGYYLLHPDKSKEFGFMFDNDETIKKDRTEIAQAILTQESGQLFHKEASHYVDFSRIYLNKEPNGNYWILVNSAEKSTILSSVTLFRTQFMIMIILVIIFVSGASFFFSKKISNPIEKLHNAAEELEKGNFKTRIDIKTGDELEELGNVLNKTTEALALMDQEHKQLDKVKTEFLSITSHELRSPMTPMRAQLQMLSKAYFGKLNKEQATAVDIVLRNTERLDKIIIDFLEISRIESARLKFSFVKQDLTESINKVVEEMKGYLPEKKITIETKIAKLPIIEVDSDRVMQVLRNLLNNAKKFSHNNSIILVNVVLKTFFTDKGEEKMIQFSIKYTGIGISQKNQRRIFEPFFQEEQTMYREYGGTGLGLAICKGIVESQNGRIRIESVKDKGTTFYFTVPLKPVIEGKAIKLLFSKGANIEKNIILLFNEILGPIGKKEFEKLNNDDFSKEVVLKYSDSLIEHKIIDEETGEIFKKRIKSIFSGDNKQLDSTTIQVKQIYIEMFGAEKGTAEFDKIKDNINKDTIIKQIDLLETLQKISHAKTKELKKRLSSIL